MIRTHTMTATVCAPTAATAANAVAAAAAAANARAVAAVCSPAPDGWPEAVSFVEHLHLDTPAQRQAAGSGGFARGPPEGEASRGER